MNPSRGIVSYAALNALRFMTMRLFPRSHLLRRAWHNFKNWYEAGWPILDPSRAYVPSLVQDARWDQNYVTRREMMRRMRYWSQNSPLLEAILSVGERYVVGATGLSVSFNPTKDADADDPWYEAAEGVVAEWFENCGWNGESMADFLKISYRDQNVDGDAFWIKTRKVGKLTQGGRTFTLPKPCLQLVEGHRVETPFNLWAEEGKSVIDGVAFKTTLVDGRPMLERTGYWVREGYGAFEVDSSWTQVPLSAIVHVLQPHRANQFRGLSSFYSCEKELSKLEELLKLEFDAQIEQSKRAVKIENASGAAASPMDNRVQRVGVTQPATALSENDRWLRQAAEFYQKTYGASTYAVKLGEKVEFDSPTRPSDATLNLWEFLINSVCAGGKAPRCLVFQKISNGSAAAQGTEVRAELDSADEFYKGDGAKWRAALKNVVIWFMEWAINNDARVADPPADWRQSICIQSPEACNVDVGWNAQANVLELAAGITNPDILFGKRGMNWRTQMRNLKRFQKFCKDNGIAVSLPGLVLGDVNLTSEGQAPAPAPERKTKRELANV